MQSFGRFLKAHYRRYGHGYSNKMSRLYVVPISGNGDCLFLSLAHAIRASPLTFQKRVLDALAPILNAPHLRVLDGKTLNAQTMRHLFAWTVCFPEELPNTIPLDTAAAARNAADTMANSISAIRDFHKHSKPGDELWKVSHFVAGMASDTDMETLFDNLTKSRNAEVLYYGELERVIPALVIWLPLIVHVFDVVGTKIGKEHIFGNAHVNPKDEVHLYLMLHNANHYQPVCSGRTAPHSCIFSEEPKNIREILRIEHTESPKGITDFPCEIAAVGFTVLERMSVSSTAVVYHACHATNCDLVVKVVPDPNVSQYEVRMLRKAESTRLVPRVVDYGICTGPKGERGFIVMTRIAGRSLSRVISDPTLGSNCAALVNVCLMAADLVREIAEEGSVVHGPLHPDDIVVDTANPEQWSVGLVDFAKAETILTHRRRTQLLLPDTLREIYNQALEQLANALLTSPPPGSDTNCLARVALALTA
jgi:hypothetical protein